MPVPNNTKTDFLKGSLDLSSDTIKVALFDDSISYSVDIDSHDFVDDILNGSTASEMSGTGYTRKTLSGKTVSVDDTDDEGVFDANDVTWSGLDAGTIQGIVVYQQIGGDDTTPGDDRVVAVLDDANVSDLPLTTNGGDVTINWPTEGIVNLG